MKLEIDLNDDEILVMQYVLAISDGRFGDPLKNIYEAFQGGDEDCETARDRGFDCYAVVGDLQAKIAGSVRVARLIQAAIPAEDV